MKDVRVSLDGKSMTSDSEYIVYSLFVPKENRQKQVRYFPFSDEWSIDLTNVRDDTPLPTLVGYYNGRDFKIRKYVICEDNHGQYDLIFTDSKKKLGQFVASRTDQENKFLDDLRKKAR